jgi:hypothetical protein
MGPVCPVQPLFGRPLDDSAAELVSFVGRDRRRASLGLARLETVEASIEVGVEPPLDGPGCNPQVGRDLLMGSAPVSRPDDLEAVVELAFGGLQKGLFEAVGLSFGQMDADHGRGSRRVESGDLLFLPTGQHQLTRQEQRFV